MLQQEGRSMSATKSKNSRINSRDRPLPKCIIEGIPKYRKAEIPARKDETL